MRNKKYFLGGIIAVLLVMPLGHSQAAVTSLTTEVRINVTRAIQSLEEIESPGGSSVTTVASPSVTGSKISQSLPKTSSQSTRVSSFIGGLLLILVGGILFVRRKCSTLEKGERDDV